MAKGKWLAAQMEQISAPIGSCAKVQRGVPLWP